MVTPFPELRRMEEKQVVDGISGVLFWPCQHLGENIKQQLKICIWSLGDQSGLKTEILESLIHRHYEWVRPYR